MTVTGANISVEDYMKAHAIPLNIKGLLAPAMMIREEKYGLESELKITSPDEMIAVVYGKNGAESCVIWTTEEHKDGSYKSKFHQRLNDIFEAAVKPKGKS